eukprot:Phypoly_transcript_22039.p1 GENE.Phypoly_transcript_22039~~Phypoly_transcript_22039.p1  ORF type:complete len:112 (+),score=19.08 Phypoly_transcript_22039:155-490(+)
MENKVSLKEEFQLLPLALDVLTRVRDSQDELEVSRAVNALNEKILKCQKILESLSGIELSRQQQQEIYDANCATLKKKQELLEQYQHLSVFADVKPGSQPEGMQIDNLKFN